MNASVEFLAGVAHHITKLMKDMVREAKKHPDIPDGYIRPALMRLDEARSIVLSARHLHALNTSSAQEARDNAEHTIERSK